MIQAVLVAGGAIVVLMQGTSPESQVSRFIEAFGLAYKHVAFSVRNLDSVTMRLFAAAGAVDTPVIQNEGSGMFLRREHGKVARKLLF
ncbi:MAG TPA: hypothetical protein VGM84_27310 [Steroidobacteraceae bacterium]|jgi:hypothetical protein